MIHHKKNNYVRNDMRNLSIHPSIHLHPFSKGVVLFVNILSFFHGLNPFQRQQGEIGGEQPRFPQISHNNVWCQSPELECFLLPAQLDTKHRKPDISVDKDYKRCSRLNNEQ